ncbi:family 20 glycosylhydrolase [Paenibacillus sp. MBLB4367]|uniref:family 20 glycosylhydrolase n=1 Tax=Paenibacillus sp. MBLB4367 TaxID=3384767 RepID=UPI0039082E21
MKLYFTGDTEGLEQGAAIVAEELGIELGESGRQVRVLRGAPDKLEVSGVGSEFRIVYGEKAHFFRAFGLLAEAARENGAFRIEETAQFATNGPMFDVSQGNAVMKVDTVKLFMRKMALMGMNMIMLYTEDSYDVAEQPYFGYMRGRYSQAELKELDDYADHLGIEMIPCIQTLSHLRDVLKWKAFADLKDDEETMLVGFERTYEFIEQMITAAMAPVRTKRIHIGLDEAWKLGLGRYLEQNGYRTKFEIMNQHVKRVLAITEKHGLKPMMWSDMYFRAGSRTGGYYDKACVIPDEVIQDMPKGVQQVYWDYYHYDEAFYEEWIERHERFGSKPVFAGGIWNWKGFCLNYGATFASTEAALNVCKRKGVTEIIATLWGDDGTECDWHAAMLGLQLFAEHGYAEKLDEAKLKRRFEFCTGARYDDFMNIKYVDETPGISPGNLETYNTSRYLLWQNVMAGLFDRNVRGLGMSEHYAKWAQEMKTYAGRNGGLSFVFELYHKLCAVLSMKADMGNRIADAYKAGDNGLLSAIAKRELPELYARVRSLREYHRICWHRANKAFGWDVMDVRYGGLLMSIDTAAERIGDFTAGRLDRLEELEEERLPFNGKDGLVDCYFYHYMPSASRVAQHF